MSSRRLVGALAPKEDDGRRHPSILYPPTPPKKAPPVMTAAQQKAREAALDKFHTHVGHTQIAALVLLVAAFSCFGYIVENRSIVGGTIAAVVFAGIGLVYAAVATALRGYAVSRKFPTGSATFSIVINGFISALCAAVSVFGYILLS